MKTLRLVKMLAAVAAIACLGLGCAGTIPPQQHFKDMERVAGEGRASRIEKMLKKDDITPETREFLLRVMDIRAFAMDGVDGFCWVIN